MSVRDFSRLRADEQRRRRDDLAAGEREVEHDVVPLEAPAPSFVARRAEDREEVAPGVAEGAQSSALRVGRRGSRTPSPSRLWRRPGSSRPPRADRCASFCCSASISSSGRPFDGRGKYAQLVRSAVSSKSSDRLRSLLPARARRATRTPPRSCGWRCRSSILGRLPLRSRLRPSPSSRRAALPARGPAPSPPLRIRRGASVHPVESDRLQRAGIGEHELDTRARRSQCLRFLPRLTAEQRIDSLRTRADRRDDQHRIEAFRQVCAGPRPHATVGVGAAVDLDWREEPRHRAARGDRPRQAERPNRVSTPRTSPDSHSTAVIRKSRSGQVLSSNPLLEIRHPARLVDCLRPQRQLADLSSHLLGHLLIPAQRIKMLLRTLQIDLDQAC